MEATGVPAVTGLWDGSPAPHHFIEPNETISQAGEHKLGPLPRHPEAPKRELASQSSQTPPAAFPNPLEFAQTAGKALAPSTMGGGPVGQPLPRLRVHTGRAPWVHTLPTPLSSPKTPTLFTFPLLVHCSPTSEQRNGHPGSPTWPGRTTKNLTRSRVPRSRAPPSPFPKVPRSKAPTIPIPQGLREPCILDSPESIVSRRDGNFPYSVPPYPGAMAQVSGTSDKHTWFHFYILHSCSF